VSSQAVSQRTLAERADQLGRELAPALEHLPEEQAARRALDALARADLLRWTVPGEFAGRRAAGQSAPVGGGADVSVRSLCAVREALAYHSGLLDVMFVMQGLGSHAVARAGSPERKREVLPEVAAGRWVAAFAVTEPEAGSDLGGVTTRAARGGTNWVLEGHKTFVSNAPIADFFTVLARTSGQSGDGGRNALTMFYVPRSAPGLRTVGFQVNAPHPIGDLFLERVVLDDSHRLGEVGAGLDLALSVLGRFRTSVAAAANGMARRALDESLRHLRARQQFGRPLAANQGLRFDLAEMDARLRASQLLVEEAAAAVEGGARATAEVARAKLFATENAWWICDRAVQHWGGLGVKTGSAVERLAREVRALRIYEGTSEIQRLILARELLGD
jgi:acyl-CoA dehydrogenase